MPLVFSAPIPFAEAAQAHRAKVLLPTDLTSAELAEQLSSDIFLRATVSAQVLYAEYLDTIQQTLQEIIDSKINLSEGMVRLQDSLRQLGYTPDAEDAGTLKDFSSEARRDLVLRTNAQVMQGYGQFVQGQTPAGLDAYPAQELFRLQSRNKERAWPARWQASGGTLYAPDGKMIALKNDPVWLEIADRARWGDGLGNPWPPFAFNSGMWTRDTSREDAISLGVIDRDTQITPQNPRLNDSLQYPVNIRSQAILDALAETLDPRFAIRDGSLIYVGGGQ